jgi:hypothetical protein
VFTEASLDRGVGQQIRQGNIEDLWATRERESPGAVVLIGADGAAEMAVVGLNESTADVDVGAGPNAGQDTATNTDGDLGEASVWVRLVGCLDC